MCDFIESHAHAVADLWGRAATIAVELGPEAGLPDHWSAPVVAHGRTLAVLTIRAGVRRDPGPSDRGCVEQLAAELAPGLALAIKLDEREAVLDDLTASMTHRRIIDLALGITMERGQVDAEAAFGLLRAQSQHANVKVHEVALGMITSIPGTGVRDLVPHFNPPG